MPIFLKYTANGLIRGLCKEKNHVGWLEILSFSYGSSSNQELNFSRQLDGSSNDIMRATLWGKGAPGTVHLTDERGKLKGEIVLEGAMVTAYSLSDGEFPVENFTLSCQSVSYKTPEQKAAAQAQASSAASWGSDRYSLSRPR